MKIMFSIITVVYNAKENVRRTINSIKYQKEYINQDLEYIIIDGGSTDGTLDVIEQYKNEIDYFVSESDKGIYDAMNKGLKIATGEYVIFMNAGDVFAEKDTLKKLKEIIIENNYPDFIYGDALELTEGGKIFYKKAYNHKFVWYGMFTHNQAMLYKKTLLNTYKIRYRLEYAIAADYAFTYEVLKYSKHNLYVDFSICIFLQGGISSKSNIKGLKEQNIIRKKLGCLSTFSINIINIIHLIKLFMRQRLKFIYNFFRYK